MTVLVPGLHLLDEETYACAGLMAAIRRLEALDAEPEPEPAPKPRTCIYRGAHRAR